MSKGNASDTANQWLMIQPQDLETPAGRRIANAVNELEHSIDALLKQLDQEGLNDISRGVTDQRHLTVAVPLCLGILTLALFGASYEPSEAAEHELEKVKQQLRDKSNVRVHRLMRNVLQALAAEAAAVSGRLEQTDPLANGTIH